MENGLWDEANIEKQRLEDKQRDARQRRKTEGQKKHNTSSNINSRNNPRNNAANNPVLGPG